MGTWARLVKGLLADEVSDDPAVASPPGARVALLQADLAAVIVRLSEGRLRAEQLDPRAVMFDRGYLDSLSYVELLVHIEARWGVRVEDTELVGRLNTLGALAADLAAKSERA